MLFGQVSAPLILDPTAGDMSKEMKSVCKDLAKVTGWRVPVVERAGKAMRSIAKAEPLKIRISHHLRTLPGGWKILRVRRRDRSQWVHQREGAG